MEKKVFGGGYTCNVCGKYQRTSTICNHDNLIKNNMKQIPTAEELMTKVSNEHSYETWGEMMYDTHEHSQIEYTREVMIEFAKLHVQQALESAAENGRTRTNDESTSIIVDSETILNAYPLDNIK